MEVDQTTYNDLSIFHGEKDLSVFHLLNFATTSEGKDWLFRFFKNPFREARLILETQQIVKLVLQKMPQWPKSISNGTVMVVSKFYETTIDTIPDRPSHLNAISYRAFHGPDFALTKYSLKHFSDFFRGLWELIQLLSTGETPPALNRHLLRARDLLGRSPAEELARREAGREFSNREVIRYGHFLRYRYKNQLQELIDIFGRIDAWYGMAAATDHYRLCFPEISESSQPYIQARGLYHVLLPRPVPYDVDMNIQSNFIFLTGANMAGKSTFIRAVGCAVFLAHLGMGVPATEMQLTVFDGLLSNINVADNIAKGESYFFNEVQRIKNTISKINDGRKWLVLIDELFKGTNVQDAMKCSSVVIRGLTRITNSLFILSTHLYEIGEELKAYPNISFKFFETHVREDQLEFSYQLRDGISNDRIGYLILKREKVVEMLDKL